ncbi:hypothetical protein NEMVEDRAFT_v1g220488 [Paramuricea clavata]|uniref:Uncharacterized protein n=1 Tax=Paramuricea clavata TaxID=317549 RepID=A0A6S7J421_PARCT|nr:hypothetical protein NEMVEDRAFT_v1g220488 [Paramuricea clavata]
MIDDELGPAGEVIKCYVSQQEKPYPNVIMQLLKRKLRRMQKKIVKASAKAKKKYEDYDWNAMFNDGSFTKQTVAVLDKYQRHHKLHSASNKKAIVSAVQRHITHQFIATSQQRKEKSDSDSRDESEIVAH